MVRKEYLTMRNKDSKLQAQAHPQQCDLLRNVSQKGMDQGHIHGPLGPIFYRIDKANVTADCLDTQFRALNMYDLDHRRHVEAQVEALLVTVSKEIRSLQLGKGLWFWWHSKWMSTASSKKTSCAFVTHLIQSLPSAWSLSSIWEGSKNYNSTETR
jgi:hypothetical protein